MFNRNVAGRWMFVGLRVACLAKLDVLLADLPTQDNMKRRS